MKKILDSYIENVIEMKKDEVRSKVGNLIRIEEMIDEFKSLNLSEEKVCEIVGIINGVSRIDTPFLLYKESINMNSKISL